MLSQPRKPYVMLQLYHPILRSKSSRFVQRCEPTCMYSLILSCPSVPFGSSCSCHLSSPLLSFWVWVFFAQDAAASLGKHGHLTRSTSGLWDHCESSSFPLACQLLRL